MEPSITGIAIEDLVPELTQILLDKFGGSLKAAAPPSADAAAGVGGADRSIRGQMKPAARVSNGCYPYN